MPEDEDFDDDNDPSVPTELLELHVELEQNEMTAQEFREVFGE